MKTKTTERLYEDFLFSNNLKISDLPEGIKRKLKVLTHWEDFLPETTGSDKADLKKRIKELDKELYKDMIDYFEDRLENNILPDKPKNKPQTDKDILDNLWRMKRTNAIQRSALKSLGLRHKLKGWSIPIGEYRLKRRAVFRYSFDLEKR